MPRLVKKEAFAELFEPLAGLHCGVVDGEGNTGDRLIYAATRQLLDEFGVSYHSFNPLADSIKHSRQFDRLLVFGGGSMGLPFKPTRCIRKSALDTGVPCVQMPQTFGGPEPDADRFDRVFVRDIKSLEHFSRAALLPDLAMGYDFQFLDPPNWRFGLFMQEGGASAFPEVRKNDPAQYCYTPAEYISHIGQFERVMTDRCHIAIIALGIGRNVTLLPCNYHKNRSIYETWLEGMGCLWADSPGDR